MVIATAMGLNCMIAPSARFIGPVTLGDRVRIHDGAVIGAPGEHRLLRSDRPSVIHIGDDTVIREHVTIMRGVDGDGPRYWGTNVGRRCYIMAGCHLEHDVQVGDDVTLSPHVCLAGHVAVLDGANLGIGVAVHQFVTVGALAMVGMNAAVLHDVPTGAKVAGVPARIIGENVVGIERSGYDAARMDELKARYAELAGARAGMVRK